MATTLLKLKELSQQTIEAIVKSPDAWKKYLNAAPNIFRYAQGSKEGKLWNWSDSYEKAV